MPKPLLLAATLAAAAALASGPAAAHARLKHATPGPGATGPSPQAVTLEFSESVVPRFSGIALADAAGHAVPLGKPASGAKPTILVATVAETLHPGPYVVSWHAVSVDTHRTQGTYRFTVAP